DLQLDPHGLGKVDVAIEIDRNGKLTAALSFDSPQAAADLRGRAGELRQALEQAGFDVSENSLTFDAAGQGAGSGGREAGQQQDRAWNGRAFQRVQSSLDDADLTLATVPANPTRRTRSGVDIRI
ncbi:MAG TPA: flagellar hook-length control protein FliK, partial [Caulobacter sp.]|nr:flagellar hook-length control protein FliK [Caulobacter sp.]